MAEAAVTDTHPLLFHAAGGHRRLGAKARRHFQACEGQDGLTYVPAVVIWETSILARVGKIDLGCSVMDFYEALFSNPAYQPLDLTPAQVFLADERRPNDDPFDGLINLAIRLLRALGVDIPLVELPIDVSVGSGAIYGLFDSPSGQLGSRGTLTLRPTVNVSGNLLKLIPQLRGFLKAVKNAGGKVSVGPGLNIIFPITITIVRLSTEDGNYLNGTFSRGAFNFTGGPRAATTDPIQDVRVTHSHTVGLAFGLEFKASASLWSIFSVSATRTINPPFRAGTVGALGPFFTALENKPLAAKLPEVVWG